MFINEQMFITEPVSGTRQQPGIIIEFTGLNPVGEGIICQIKHEKYIVDSSLVGLSVK